MKKSVYLLLPIAMAILLALVACDLQHQSIDIKQSEMGCFNYSGVDWGIDLSTVAKVLDKDVADFVSENKTNRNEITSTIYTSDVKFNDEIVNGAFSFSSSPLASTEVLDKITFLYEDISTEKYKEICDYVDSIIIQQGTKILKPNEEISDGFSDENGNISFVESNKSNANDDNPTHKRTITSFQSEANTSNLSEKIKAEFNSAANFAVEKISSNLSNKDKDVDYAKSMQQPLSTASIEFVETLKTHSGFCKITINGFGMKTVKSYIDSYRSR